MLGLDISLLAILKLNDKPLSTILEKYGLTYARVQERGNINSGHGMRVHMSPQMTQEQKSPPRIMKRQE